MYFLKARVAGFVIQHWGDGGGQTGQPARPALTGELQAKERSCHQGGENSLMKNKVVFWPPYTCICTNTSSLHDHENKNISFTSF